MLKGNTLKSWNTDNFKTIFWSQTVDQLQYILFASELVRAADSEELTTKYLWYGFDIYEIFKAFHNLIAN